MNKIADLPDADLHALHRKVRADYDAFRARGLKLDMTRGKPAPDQLDLANAMLTFPGNRDFHSEAGDDARNYGVLQGLPEARALFAPMLDAPPAQVVVADNSSLAVMHDCIVWALLKGVPGSDEPWGKAPAFICPVPGYDRHFALCEEYGIRMLPVPMTGHGPDMDAVEDLVADPSVKGMWCVPKYSNPASDVYSDETVARLAAMRTGAPDFRLFWDNAYSVHHLTERRHAIANILDATRAGRKSEPSLHFRLNLEDHPGRRRVGLLRFLTRQRRLVPGARLQAHDRVRQAEPVAPCPLPEERGRADAPHGRPPSLAGTKIRRGAGRIGQPPHRHRRC